jgi:hypothetical protein
MSIFTIELNPDFKIFNDKIFYQKNEFIKKCKLNNINYDNDIKLIKNSSIIDNSSLNTVEAVIEIINSSIYTDNNKNILFPEWKIFQVGYENNKNILSHSYNGLFEKYIQLFSYIAEVRYKDYLIRNINNYNYNLKLSHNIYKYLDEYQQNKKIETNNLYEFLIFLTNLYQDFKDIEKYKLMWNIETYIVEVIRKLISNGEKIETIYNKNIGGAYSCGNTFSKLHEFYIYKPLYIKEKQVFIISDAVTNKINELYNTDISKNDIWKIIASNEVYSHTLFLYLEIIDKLNYDKIDEYSIATTLRSLVIDFEKIIRNYLKCKDTTVVLYHCIKNLNNDSKTFENLKKKLYKKNDILNSLNNIIKEDESIEKHMLIYYSARNYIAHQKIDVKEFFWSKNQTKESLRYILYSIIILIYFMEKNIYIKEVIHE